MVLTHLQDVWSGMNPLQVAHLVKGSLNKGKAKSAFSLSTVVLNRQGGNGLISV